MSSKSLAAARARRAGESAPPVSGNRPITSIGSNAGQQITTGSENSILGFSTLGNLTTGNFNSTCGCYTLLDTNGSYNTAIGHSAGENDVGLSSFNTYVGAQATQEDTDTYSYEYLTLIGAGSTPILQGINDQIVFGRATGEDDIYIPSGNIYLGDSNINSTYTIQASGNNSDIRFQTLPSTGAPYQNTLTLSTTSTTIQSGQIFLNGDVSVTSPNSLTVNNTTYTDLGGDPAFGTANPVIYFNGTAPSLQQLRVNINGAQYYINLSPI
jgi:hypothetical protein